MELIGHDRNQTNKQQAGGRERALSMREQLLAKIKARNARKGG
jgi:hypothetical protein